MSSGACRAALEDGPVESRAPRLDAAFPACVCEPFSLTAAGGEGIQDDDFVARILTSPDAYDENEETILTQKLTSLWAMGLSVVRRGASDQEILDTIENLISNAAEERALVGAVVMTAAQYRAYLSGDDRWFAVYATDDRGKQHHGDVFGTIPAGGTSLVRRIQRERRYKLAEDMLPCMIREGDRQTLINRLRAAGI